MELIIKEKQVIINSIEVTEEYLPLVKNIVFEIVNELDITFITMSLDDFLDFANRYVETTHKHFRMRFLEIYYEIQSLPKNIHQ